MVVELDLPAIGQHPAGVPDEGIGESLDQCQRQRQLAIEPGVYHGLDLDTALPELSSTVSGSTGSLPSAATEPNMGTVSGPGRGRVTSAEPESRRAANPHEVDYGVWLPLPQAHSGPEGFFGDLVVARLDVQRQETPLVGSAGLDLLSDALLVEVLGAPGNLFGGVPSLAFALVMVHRVCHLRFLALDPAPVYAVGGAVCPSARTGCYLSLHYLILLVAIISFSRVTKYSGDTVGGLPRMCVFYN